MADGGMTEDRSDRTGRASGPDRDIVLIHSSDVHVDHHYTPKLFDGDGTGSLRAVLNAARKAGADVVLLAGDTFDCHRLPSELLERTASVLQEFSIPVVILPGNHDPAVEDAVFHHRAFADVACLSVLGITHDEAVHFPQFDLEVWGRAHRDYSDMDPFAHPRPRTARWHVAMGHGHYTPEPDRSTHLRPSWLIGDDELNATDADYVALGHWNRWVKVGSGPVQAWYSGSFDYAQSVNRVTLSLAGSVEVERIPLDLPENFSQFNEGQPA
ncbi:MAG: metallophosphoesterase [Hyphomicrobiales bacterium]|nr:metallophosphoesterase [Hyphomicrobiales bacterium]